MINQHLKSVYPQAIQEIHNLKVCIENKEISECYKEYNESYK